VTVRRAGAKRAWAWPLVPLYAAGLALKDGLRATAMLPTRTLKWPVVSVGSLSAGGAGKTPVVIALVELLQERKWCVDVLSRGYRREGKAVERVAPAASEAGRRFGDEPVLIARRTGVPVWLASKRFLAGEAAEAASETAARCVHVLDDGFQHRQLARGVDVVLVTAADLEDVLLPAGNLREPLRALKRADVVVIRDDEQRRVEERVRRLMRPDALLWTVRRELQVDAAAAAGPRPLAFCAIARSEGFVAMLADGGRPVVTAEFFEDHHLYEMADIERLVRIAREVKATGFVTTEKDEVKLSAAMVERLRSIGPVCAVPLQAVFVEADRVARELEARIS
jgi:tetraacyldisaccharide 4'-kinase